MPHTVLFGSVIVMAKKQDTAKSRSSQNRSKEQEVLDIASGYFLAHGYQGTSINAMARDSGISKESIYRYFSSKKELFEAVIDKEVADYQSSLARLNVELDHLDLRAALLTVAQILLGTVASDRTLALRRLIFQESIRTPEIGQHYHQIGPQYAYQNLKKLFQDHRKETDFDASTLSHNFVALVLHRTILERNCAVSKSLTKAQTKQQAATTVDDFMKAYFRD